MAWHLARQGRWFVVLEAAAELGHVWRSRWDSLTLFTPAQYDALPGMAFPAPADTYPTKDPVADYLQAYAAAFDLPVRLSATATERRRLEDGRFQVQTAEETDQAQQVVVATGPFQVPFLPPGLRAGPLGGPAPQRGRPQPPGPPRRGRCWSSAGQLGVPDSRGAGRHPHRRPLHRHHGAPPWRGRGARPVLPRAVLAAHPRPAADLADRIQDRHRATMPATTGSGPVTAGG